MKYLKKKKLWGCKIVRGLVGKIPFFLLPTKEKGGDKNGKNTHNR